MPMNHVTLDHPKALFWLTKQHHIMQQPSHNTSSTYTNSQFYPHYTTATSATATATATAAMFGAQNAGHNNFFNLNNGIDDVEDSEEQQNRSAEEEVFSRTMIMPEIPKVPLFEKPLTPSDVGKLNRLVIPKQHAEKYFPMAVGVQDSGTGAGAGAGAGVLLSFEDEGGKTWRFRYSYWSSSQSYVLTKGWSRFVKEKRLDAGDVVLFGRHRGDGDRLFIGWRRRSGGDGSSGSSGGGGGAVGGQTQPPVTAVGGWAPAWRNPYPPPATAIPYQTNCLHAGSSSGLQVETGARGNTKRSVRLFGVNLELECEPNDESEPTTPSNHGQTAPFQYLPNNHYNHMDMNFSRDVNQMRYHQG